MKLPDPYGYLCDWGPAMGCDRQVFYYSEPGNGIDDDWNEMPKVHRNLPLYTHEQVLQIIADLQATPGASP